jgi:hypothetical protein
MPADAQSKSNGPLPSPWKEFLSEIDSMLKEPLQLHCIGGFVICYFYGTTREHFVSNLLIASSASCVTIFT